MTPALLEWDCAMRAVPGEPVSGDRARVMVADGRALAMAVDGLGHGPEAAVAAQRAVDLLGDGADEDVVGLAERCHAALRVTRGAAMSVAALDGHTGKLTWLGVGDVEGRLVHAGVGAQPRAESLLLLNGIVGHDLPPLRASTARVARGDLLLFATDGIEPAFADSFLPSGSCAHIASELLKRYARPTDDALVFVARYLGDSR